MADNVSILITFIDTYQQAAASTNHGEQHSSFPGPLSL
jgi:hypothetical protein